MGEADGIKVLDVVNPQSFREFILDDFDDSRIPLWTVNAELPVGAGGTVQLLWIPDTTYHELAEPGTPYEWTSPLYVPHGKNAAIVAARAPDKPDNPLQDSDAGIRYSTFAGGWDMTLNYLYHYHDLPVFYQRATHDQQPLELTVAPEYERNHLLGGTLSNAFGDTTIRAEIAYSSDTFHTTDHPTYSNSGIEESSELAAVLGLDWQLGGSDKFLSLQWFVSHLFDYRRDIIRDETEHNLSALYRQMFINETLQLDVLGLYSPNRGDSSVQLKLSYLVRSNLELWVGGDFFSGDDDGLFGQFADRDRVLLGFKLGF